MAISQNRNIQAMSGSSLTYGHTKSAQTRKRLSKESTQKAAHHQLRQHVGRRQLRRT